MNSDFRVSFVVVSNNQEILRNNLLASPCLQDGQTHQIIIQEGFTSASDAYNDALGRCIHDLVVFVHQDVFLPQAWLSHLQSAITTLDSENRKWGVLGCWGLKQTGEEFGYLYTPGQGVIGHELKHPERVQTLDEVVLVLRRSSGLKFNERVQGFHFYGSDICLSAKKAGLNCYAISAFCIHNSREYFRLPPDFYEAYRHFKQIWKEELPIQTSCIRISRFDRDLWERRTKESVRKMIHQNDERGPRPENPKLILEQLIAANLI